MEYDTATCSNRRDLPGRESPQYNPPNFSVDRKDRGRPLFGVVLPVSFLKELLNLVTTHVDPTFSSMAQSIDGCGDEE